MHAIRHPSSVWRMGTILEKRMTLKMKITGKERHLLVVDLVLWLRRTGPMSMAQLMALKLATFGKQGWNGIRTSHLYVFTFSFICKFLFWYFQLSWWRTPAACGWYSRRTWRRLFSGSVWWLRRRRWSWRLLHIHGRRWPSSKRH